MSRWNWPMRFRLRFGATWAEDFDFAGPRIRTAWWAWLVLGLGVALALKVSDEFERIRMAMDEGQAQFKRLSRAERQLRLAQAPAVLDEVSSVNDRAAAPAWSGPALADALTMGLLLGYPWGAALNQLEAQTAGHQAVMLGLSVDLTGLSDAVRAQQPLWRLQAAVRGDADAMAWALSLPQGRLITRERLPQPFNGLSGAYSFKVQLQMSPFMPVASDPPAVDAVVKS